MCDADPVPPQRKRYVVLWRVCDAVAGEVDHLSVLQSDCEQREEECSGE